MKHCVFCVTRQKQLFTTTTTIAATSHGYDWRTCPTLSYARVPDLYFNCATGKLRRTT